MHIIQMCKRSCYASIVFLLKKKKNYVKISIKMNIKKMNERNAKQQNRLLSLALTIDLFANGDSKFERRKQKLQLQITLKIKQSQKQKHMKTFSRDNSNVVYFRFSLDFNAFPQGTPSIHLLYLFDKLTSATIEIFLKKEKVFSFRQQN